MDNMSSHVPCSTCFCCSFRLLGQKEKGHTRIQQPCHIGYRYRRHSMLPPHLSWWPWDGHHAWNPDRTVWAAHEPLYDAWAHAQKNASHLDPVTRHVGEGRQNPENRPSQPGPRSGNCTVFFILILDLQNSCWTLVRDSVSKPTPDKGGHPSDRLYSRSLTGRSLQGSVP